MTTRLQGRLEALYGLERRKDKLGLDGTRALLRALGDPQSRFRSVHVAGTNGKGSVCALVERVLREAGHRTGLYTSPHLVDFRERIRVNGRWVDEAWLEQALDRIESLPEGQDRTFFEIATVLAFLDFAERGVEIAVVEVGLGGRLDCTNVITPEVSVITSIGLDHQEILGHTLEQIAAEKAGIAKPGVPLVVNPAIDAPALATVERIASERHAPWVLAGAAGAAEDLAGSEPGVALSDGPWGAGLRVAVGIQGAMVDENAGVAAAALAVLVERGWRIPEAALRSGFREARWPGRLEASPHEPRLWWDGAHNPQGVDSLRRAGPFGAVVLALSRDKDAAEMLGRLWSVMRPAPLVASRSRNERAMDPQAIAAAAAAIGWSARVEPDLATALRIALDLARSNPAKGRDRVLLTGSLFAVGEAMAVMGGAPGEQL